MPQPISRRALLGAAAVLIAPQEASPQVGASWTLLATLKGSPAEPLLRAVYALDPTTSGPLFLQVQDPGDDPVQFLFWQRLVYSQGEFLFQVGPYGQLPYGRTYELSIVTGDGTLHPMSPVVHLFVPDYTQDLLI